MSTLGLEQVATALREVTGLKLDPVIGPDLASAAQRASKRLGIDSLSTLAQMLRADNRVDDELVAELTVGETYFLRDQPHFDFVRDRVLPERAAARRDDLFRIWSAGCSTGEEAWSLAMLCRQLQLPAFDVLATDLSVSALSKARAGAYGAWSVTRCSNPLAAQWLRNDNGVYRIDDTLKSNVRFEYLNLASDTYPRAATGTSGLDLIFCRNVLIYLDPSTVGLVYQKLIDALAIGGFLVCGPSDPPAPAHLPCRRLDTGMGCAYVREAHAPLTAERPLVLLAPQHIAPPRIRENKREQPSPVALPMLAVPAADWTQVVVDARALSNLGHQALALDRVTIALRALPESVELRFLNAALLLGAGDLSTAVEELRRVLYLDPSLAMAHFTLALTLHRLGKQEDAGRAYRNAERLAAGRPEEELVPLSDGQSAGRLAHSSRAQLKLLGGPLGD